MSEPPDEFSAMIANQTLNAYGFTSDEIAIPAFDVAPPLVPISGGRDGLDYGGPLNLLATTEPRVCALHPQWGENTRCPRCREILQVRRLRGRISQLIKLASHYENLVCVCTESCQGHLDQDELDAVQDLICDLGLRWDCEDAGGFIADDSA